MRGANVFEGNADRVTKIIIVATPAGDVGVEELAEGRRGPSAGVHAVCDGGDRVIWKHATRNFAVSHGDSVNVRGETQREVGHVKSVAVQRLRFLQQVHALIAQQLLHEPLWELI